MENNNEKKLYTLLVYSENIAGILNQITAVFTRRQVNIESLNVSASSIKNIHKYTITVWSDEEQIEKINKAIEKKIRRGRRAITTPTTRSSSMKWLSSRFPLRYCSKIQRFRAPSASMMPA